MSEKRQFRAIKGVRDILPPESAAWNRVEQAAREVFESYGYGEIRLPIFEQLELFARSVGADTDIVSKEMFFAFQDKPEFPQIQIGNWDSVVAYLSAANDALKKGSFEAEDKAPFERFGKASERLTMDKWQNDHMGFAQAVLESVSALQEVQWGSVLALRPEATASVCRAYIEHGLHTRPGNVKLYYIGPMFRRERPQKGRYRQFYQIGAEVLTPTLQKEESAKERAAMAAVDAELIEMLLHFFARIGLGEGGSQKSEVGSRKSDVRPQTSDVSATGGGTDNGLRLYYNSIGCRECRPKYVAQLKAALEKVKDKLGPDSQRRIDTNPLRVLDSKVESEQAVIETLPRIADHLCEKCREHLAALREQFKLRGIVGEENWRLVRGLDYYTRTTFEITAPGLGSQNAVCGGGRYDGLVELLGGNPTRGIGFAIGTDRLMLSLAEAGKLAASAGCDVFVAWMGAATEQHAIRLARKLREAGFRVEVPAEEQKFRKALDLANRLEARYALIIGENEVAAGRYGLKRLADGVQKELTEGELVEFLSGEKAAG